MDNVIDIKIYQEAKQIKENLDRKNMTIEDLDLDSISLEVLDCLENLYLQDLQEERKKMALGLERIEELKEEKKQLKKELDLE